MTPEQIIQAPGFLDAWQFGYVSRFCLRTRGPKVWTDAERMPTRGTDAGCMSPLSMQTLRERVQATGLAVDAKRA